MIKKITQYLVICDNSFCDSIVKSVVDFHSYERQQQFEMKIKSLGWKIQEGSNEMGPQNFICPDCLLFTSELEKTHPVLMAIKKKRVI